MSALTAYYLPSTPLIRQQSDLSRFTTWGNGFSCGRAIGEAISMPGIALEVIGSSCQKVKWLPLNATGIVIGNIGSAARGIGCLAGSITTLLERLTLNITKTLGGIGIATIGIFVAPFDTSLFKLGTVWIKDAWTTRENIQQDLALETGERARAIYYCKDYYNPDRVPKFEPDAAIKKDIQENHIPDTWASACSFDENNDYRLKINDVFPVKVRVNWDPNKNLHIRFDGGLVYSVVSNLLGIEDATFRNARKLVQDFATKNPGKVHVSGFCFGGALAQYAGISAGVPVTCFNSFALSPALIDKMVDWNGANLDKIKNAKVEHFNAKDDWLAQKLQSSYSLKWLNLNQLGARYIVPQAYCRKPMSNDEIIKFLFGDFTPGKSCFIKLDMKNDSHSPPHMIEALNDRL